MATPKYEQEKCPVPLCQSRVTVLAVTRPGTPREHSRAMCYDCAQGYKQFMGRKAEVLITTLERG